MEIKTALVVHLTLVRMAIIKKQTTNAAEDSGNRNPYMLLLGTQISAASMEISMEVPQKTKARTTIKPCCAIPEGIKVRIQ
jgi:hypothetical protein